MLLFFADDTKQSRPTRTGMGTLAGAGAICVREEEVRVLELQLSKICADAGFPDGEEFKWSPGRDAWMRTNLTDDARQAFYRKVLEVAKLRGVTASVVIADTVVVDPVTGVAATEADVTRLLLELIHLQIPLEGCGIVVADRPGGSREQEDSFLASCLEALKAGTRHVRNLELISLMLTANSRMVRLLQLADLVTSCTAACVAGHRTFAPATFEHIRPLMRTNGGRIGGTGLKIHPPERYANLYHWLVGDLDYVHHNTTYTLPMPGFPYATSETSP